MGRRFYPEEALESLQSLLSGYVFQNLMEFSTWFSLWYLEVCSDEVRNGNGAAYTLCSSWVKHRPKFKVAACGGAL